MKTYQVELSVNFDTDIDIGPQSTKEDLMSFAEDITRNLVPTDQSIGRIVLKSEDEDTVLMDMGEWVD